MQRQFVSRGENISQNILATGDSRMDLNGVKLGRD